MIHAKKSLDTVWCGQGIFGKLTDAEGHVVTCEECKKRLKASKRIKRCPANCSGCEYCCDAYGVDACKDANAEMGLPPYHSAGYHEAKRRGWLSRS